MRKRVIIFIALVLFISCLPLSALDFLAAGGGLRITPYTERMSISSDNFLTATVSYNWVDWGLYAFFDAKYVELNITYYRALSGKYEQSNFGALLDLITEYGALDISYLDLALMGKIPITTGPTGSIFLFGGFAYKFSLTSDYRYKYNSGDVPKEFWDQMWLKFGGSYDIPFNRRLFARTAFSVGFPIITKEWVDRRKIFETLMAGSRGLDISYFGIGAELSAAIGYRIR